MTQDEIMEMARQAGFFVMANSPDLFQRLEAFANLVAARDYERGFIDGMQKQMQSSVDKAVNRMAQPKQDGECKYCTDGCPACDARRQSNVLP